MVILASVRIMVYVLSKSIGIMLLDSLHRDILQRKYLLAIEYRLIDTLRSFLVSGLLSSHSSFASIPAYLSGS